MLFLYSTVITLSSLSLLASKEFFINKFLSSEWSVKPLNIDQYSSSSSSIKLQFRIALFPTNTDKLQQAVHSIADPKSKDYRRYLSNEDITSIVQPSEDDLSKLFNWLTVENQMVIVEMPPNKDWVTVSASISSIEKCFQTKLASWENSRSGLAKVGAVASYSIPDEMAHIVQFIPGMTSFSFGSWRPIVHEHQQKSSSSLATTSTSTASTPAAITPDIINEIYQSHNNYTDGDKSPMGSQAVIEYGVTANFNEADLQTFFKSYASDLVGQKCSTAYGINNGVVRASVEANLDVQYIMAVGRFVNTSTYKIAEVGVNIEDQMLDYAYIVGNQTAPPLVHSISYGEYGGQYDNNTVQRFDYELQKMAARGITVLLASGDNGVGCSADGSSQEFDYPSSIYITMVGATYLDTVSGVEIGATLSSGGFSKDQYRPSWQDDAVEGYFNSATYQANIPHESFEKNGRAYPDVSAFGQNVKVVTAGTASGVSGTSCSAPIFAGIISLLNNELLKRERAPMGWINPWIYANPQMFTDITAGSNPYQKCDGFVAAKGWDPVTGMGTPIYPEMLKAALRDF